MTTMENTDTHALLSLRTLNNGDTLEKIDQELRQLVKNIADPDTNPEAVRELTVVFKLRPNKQRTVTSMEIILKPPKLAPVKPDEATLQVAFLSGGVTELVEIKGKQTEIFKAKEQKKEVET